MEDLPDLEELEQAADRWIIQYEDFDLPIYERRNAKEMLEEIIGLANSVEPMNPNEIRAKIWIMEDLPETIDRLEYLFDELQSEGVVRRTSPPPGPSSFPSGPSSSYASTRSYENGGGYNNGHNNTPPGHYGHNGQNNRNGYSDDYRNKNARYSPQAEDLVETAKRIFRDYMQREPENGPAAVKWCLEQIDLQVIENQSLRRRRENLFR